jgi:hypothetical protein
VVDWLTPQNLGTPGAPLLAGRMVMLIDSAMGITWEGDSIGITADFCRGRG